MRALFSVRSMGRWLRIGGLSLASFGAAASYGNDASATPPKPYNVLVLGDSIMDGQANGPDQKLVALARDFLQARIPERPVNLYSVAHSGAAIARPQAPRDELAPEGFVFTDTGANGPSLYPGAPKAMLRTFSVLAQSPTAPFNFVKRLDIRGEIPQVVASISYQAERLGIDALKPLSPLDVSLVIMDGGINDVDIMEIISPAGVDKTYKDRSQYVVDLTHDHAGKRMAALLDGIVLPTYKNAQIVVTGYYPIISAKTPPAMLDALLGKTFGVRFGAEAIARGALSVYLPVAASQSAAFSDTLEADYSALMTDPRRLGRVMFAKVPWMPDDSYGTSTSLLGTIAATHDALYQKRKAVCDNPTNRSIQNKFGPHVHLPVGGDFVNSDIDGANLPSTKCEIAQTGHPNPKGSQRFAMAIASALSGNVLPPTQPGNVGASDLLSSLGAQLSAEAQRAIDWIWSELKDDGDIVLHGTANWAQWDPLMPRTSECLSKHVPSKWEDYWAGARSGILPDVDHFWSDASKATRGLGAIDRYVVVSSPYHALRGSVEQRLRDYERDRATYVRLWFMHTHDADAAQDALSSAFDARTRALLRELDTRFARDYPQAKAPDPFRIVHAHNAPSVLHEGNSFNVALSRPGRFAPLTADNGTISGAGVGWAYTAPSSIAAPRVVELRASPLDTVAQVATIRLVLMPSLHFRGPCPAFVSAGQSVEFSVREDVHVDWAYSARAGEVRTASDGKTLTVVPQQATVIRFLPAGVRASAGEERIAVTATAHDGRFATCSFKAPTTFADRGDQATASVPVSVRPGTPVELRVMGAFDANPEWVIDRPGAGTLGAPSSKERAELATVAAPLERVHALLKQRSAVGTANLAHRVGRALTIGHEVLLDADAADALENGPARPGMGGSRGVTRREAPRPPTPQGKVRQLSPEGKVAAAQTQRIPNGIQLAVLRALAQRSLTGGELQEANGHLAAIERSSKNVASAVAALDTLDNTYFAPARLAGPQTVTLQGKARDGSNRAFKVVLNIAK